jgi:uncharacterized protein involved in exopolysaccharide biosynthesis
MTEVITGLISAAAAIIVCVINNAKQQKAAKQQHDTTIALIEYKLDQLDKRVTVHNNVVSRLYEVERKLGIDEERINVANHRIDDLEQYHK